MVKIHTHIFGPSTQSHPGRAHSPRPRIPRPKRPTDTQAHKQPIRPTVQGYMYHVHVEYVSVKCQLCLPCPCIQYCPTRSGCPRLVPAQEASTKPGASWEARTHAARFLMTKLTESNLELTSCVKYSFGGTQRHAFATRARRVAPTLLLSSIGARARGLLRGGTSWTLRYARDHEGLAQELGHAPAKVIIPNDPRHGQGHSRPPALA